MLQDEYILWSKRGPAQGEQNSSVDAPSHHTNSLSEPNQRSVLNHDVDAEALVLWKPYEAA